MRTAAANDSRCPLKAKESVPNQLAPPDGSSFSFSAHTKLAIAATIVTIFVVVALGAKISEQRHRAMLSVTEHCTKRGPVY
jgi:hypothetical protein